MQKPTQLRFSPAGKPVGVQHALNEVNQYSVTHRPVVFRFSHKISVLHRHCKPASSFCANIGVERVKHRLGHSPLEKHDWYDEKLSKMLLEAISSSSSESNASNLICSRILKGSPFCPAKSENTHAWRHARGLARTLIPEPRHAVHTHTREPVVALSRSREAVRSWDSVHGSQTRAIAIGGQPVVNWCLPLSKRAGAQTCRCGFSGELSVSHDDINTHLPPPSCSSVPFVYLYLADL